MSLAIQEEFSKQVPGDSQASAGKKPLEEAKPIRKTSQASGEIKELEGQLRDREIASHVKDQVVKNFEKDREAFNEERQHYVSQLMAHSRKVGELEAQLLQLGAPGLKKELPEGSEEFGSLRRDRNRLRGEHNDDSTDVRRVSQDY